MSEPVVERQTGQTVAARACFEVVAGLIPGQPMDEFTRRWWITARDLDGPHAAETWKHHQDAAYDYAKSLCDPGSLNWCRVDWIWF